MIEDDGTGFTKKDQKRVLEKFSREHPPDNTGSGLGLSIVKGFTEALGGRVRLERGSCGGARFLVTIPVKTNTL
jgi:Signal transduction histidine kinase